MKRLWLSHFGLDGLGIEEGPKPSISTGYARVRVHAAGLNPSDLANVKGSFPQTTLPRVPGRDYAGIVDDGPEDWRGAAVWGAGSELGFTEDGTHAEYVVVTAASLSRKPEQLSFAAAAAAGIPFVTAYLAMITAAQVRPGKGPW